MKVLETLHDGRKSFYGKAHTTSIDGAIYLISYDTVIASIDNDGNFHKLWGGYSATSGRHLWEFLLQYSPKTVEIYSNSKAKSLPKWLETLPLEKLADGMEGL